MCFNHLGRELPLATELLRCLGVVECSGIQVTMKLGYIASLKFKLSSKAALLLHRNRKFCVLVQAGAVIPCMLCQLNGPTLKNGTEKTKLHKRLIDT